MAETAQDVIPTSDVPEKEVSNIDNANGTIASKEEKIEKLGEQEQVIEGVKESAAEVNTDEKHDDKRDEKHDGKRVDTETRDDGSHSPDRRRKEYPGSQDKSRDRGRAGLHNKNRARFEDQPESSDAGDIRRQVEFYFSDSNLPIDAHLLQQTGGRKNNPVALSVIHSFKRMRHFQPFEAVRDAVKQSEFLDLNDRDEITRKRPLDEKFTDDPEENRNLVHTEDIPRSIYAKGFGDETATTHLDIEAFFQPYGPTKAVRMRRDEHNGFKGSVFVEFVDEKTQQGFLELAPKPQWNGKDLVVMSKREYVDTKCEGILDGIVKPKSQKYGKGYSRGGGNRRGGKREWIDRDDWKGRRDHDQAGDRRGGRGGRGGPKRGTGRRGGQGARYRTGDREDRDRHHHRRGEDDRDDSRPPRRAEAESKKMEKDRDATAQAQAGAEADKGESKGAKAEAKSETDGSGPAIAGKKRAREDDGADASGEAKKVKEDASA
ncbi:hypothetical protein B0A50_02847 [Salinomyces thailandicus]|uniref:Uncharacterized protein n=1 Tax=Salinomyces thailandicus TaxID=706561 RepID=A0A4U0U557_9PEZI|nr:hypothetical protein B0A50_02847 [Salinomyces thailandica]